MSIPFHSLVEFGRKLSLHLTLSITFSNDPVDFEITFNFNDRLIIENFSSNRKRKALYLWFQ
jgi:hypothetical protein